MRNLIYIIAGLIFAASLLFTACSGGPDIQNDTKTAKGEVPEWTIAVSGEGNTKLTGADYMAMRNNSEIGVEISLEKKGETSLYTGIPFKQIVALADGGPSSGFDADLWKAGYDITLTASDGYSVTFNTADIDVEELYLVNSKDGTDIPPQTVGDVPGNLWVKELILVELEIGPSGRGEENGPGFQLTLDIGGTEHTFTLDELEATPYYTEGKGSFTTSAGTTYTHTYGGVVLADLLESYFDLKPDTTVTFVASDGYEMSYSGKEIMDTTNGEWILAFKSDGSALPLDPGPIRTVKIGPETPNIEGHLSVKMIEKIKVDEEGFSDFTLEMKGKMNFSLDRQTVQSCVNCHRKSVTYHDGKNDRDFTYTGFPVWRILAYSDDPDYAPHKQDKSILSYSREAMNAGYDVTITAADGFSITLDAAELDMNQDVILALYKEGGQLPEREQPIVIVWDKNSSRVPDGIKPVRSIEEITLEFD
jgi:hypothetical protein